MKTFAQEYCPVGIHGYRKIEGIWVCYHCGAVKK